MVITSTCKSAHTINAITIFRLLKRPMRRTEPSLRILNAWTSSERLKTANAIVLPTDTAPGTSKKLRPITNESSASAPIIMPSNAISIPSPPENRLCFCAIGLRFIISGSTFSTPSAIAGSASVTRFTHKSCIGSSGVGRCITDAANMTRISPILQESRK